MKVYERFLEKSVPLEVSQNFNQFRGIALLNVEGKIFCQPNHLNPGK